MSEQHGAIVEAKRWRVLETESYSDTPQRRRERKFTRGVKRAFVALIAKGYSPTRAASEVGVSRQAAYKQRGNDPDFADAWDEALQQQADLYEDALRQAAIEQKNIGGIIFGLKNLRPDKWRDKHEVELESRASLEPLIDMEPAAQRALNELLLGEAKRMLSDLHPEHPDFPFWKRMLVTATQEPTLPGQPELLGPGASPLEV